MNNSSLTALISSANLDKSRSGFLTWYLRSRLRPQWLEDWSTRRKEYLYRRYPERRLRASALYEFDLETRDKRWFRRSHYHSIKKLNIGFPYEPIDPKTQIRVLELAPGQHDEPFSGRLIRETLEDVAPYDAISYCWGSHKAAASLDCGYAYLVVTKSVSDILWQFRDSREAKRLWIDAVCLDQSDSGEEERSAQIVIMDKIYQKADIVHVWLGEEDETTAEAISLVEIGFTACTSAHERHGPAISIKQLKDYGLPEETDLRWNALRSLSYRPYFSRTWTLQEVANAANFRVWCGRNSCEGYKFKKFSEILNTTSARHVLNAEYLARPATVFGFSAALNEPGSALLELLGRAFGLRSSDPRDKVFALVGMAHDKDKYIDLVDYGQAVDRVYCLVAKRLILDGWQDTLNFARDPPWRSVQALPSWVPDWSSGPSVGPSLFAQSGYRKRLQGLLVESPRFSSDDRILTMQSSFMDKVKGIGQRFTTRVARAYWPLMRIRLERWRYFALEESHSYPTGGTMLEAFARTIVAREYWTASSDFASATAMYHAIVTKYVNSLTSRTIPRTYETDRQRAMYDYDKRMFSVCQTRSFFITENGYIGLGPYFLHRGDLIVELYAGMTPFAIRPLKNGRYTLVGEVFVHGCMGDLDYSSLTFQDIELE